MELDRQKVEKAWQLRLQTNSSLRRLLMPMIKAKAEDQPFTREILGDAYFRHVEVSNDTFDACD